MHGGSRKVTRVAVIDSGYNVTKNSKVKYCDEKLNKDFTTTGLEDRFHHGSHVTNIIADSVLNRDSICFIIIKAFDPETPKYFINATSRLEFQYLLQILKKGDVINYSAGGNGSSVDEKLAIYKLLYRGVKIFVAAGNDGTNLDKDCNYFPACYNFSKLNVVGNMYDIISRDHSSNYGKVVTNWEIGHVISDNGTGEKVTMNGTSQATAVATRKYLDSLNK